MSITIHPIAPQDVRFLAFSDASFASKRVPDSHAGMIILTTHKDIVHNVACPVSPVSWGCKKIQKVVTSTLSAETMALTSTLDQLSWLRLFWAWLLDSRTVWQDPTQTLSKLPPAVASPTWKAQALPEATTAVDCKSLFDLVTKTAPPQCSEFRTQLHARAIKDLLSENTTLRWVHSGAQLADALTKIMEACFLRSTLIRNLPSQGLEIQELIYFHLFIIFLSLVFSFIFHFFFMMIADVFFHHFFFPFFFIYFSLVFSFVFSLFFHFSCECALFFSCFSLNVYCFHLLSLFVHVT